MAKDRTRQHIPMIILKGDIILNIFYKDFDYVPNSMIFSFFRFRYFSFLFKLFKVYDIEFNILFNRQSIFYY